MFSDFLELYSSGTQALTIPKITWTLIEGPREDGSLTRGPSPLPCSFGGVYHALLVVGDDSVVSRCLLASRCKQHDGYRYQTSRVPVGLYEMLGLKVPFIWVLCG